MPSADTIVAVATPPGRGGLAVIRLSGPLARDITSSLCDARQPLEARRATLVRIVAGEPGTAGVTDEAVATLFTAPASYTGEDVVEIGLHGSPFIVAEVLSAAVRAGARIARAGEFTLRAFLNGRLDLTQAEAVADLVNATTPVQARIAFDQMQGTLSGRIREIERALFDLVARLEASVDFPDEGYHFIEPQEALLAVRGIRAQAEELLAGAKRGRILREGATVAIVGRPNVGKSTLFNRLAGAERAIVTDIAGTTRDLLTERVDLGGVQTTLVDTAGLRSTTADAIEREGVLRAEQAGAVADVVVAVFDISEPLTAEDERVLEATAARPRVLVANKSDRPRAWTINDFPAAQGGSGPVPGGRSGCREPVLLASAATGSGIDEVILSITITLAGHQPCESINISNIRHSWLLGQTTEILSRVEEAMKAGAGGLPEEVLLADLCLARESLEEVTGQRTTEDLLDAIFSRFCIGK